MSDDASETDESDRDRDAESTSDDGADRDDDGDSDGDAVRHRRRFRDLRTKLQDGETGTNEPTASESTSRAESGDEADPEATADQPAGGTDSDRDDDGEDDWEWFQDDAASEMNGTTDVDRAEEAAGAESETDGTAIDGDDAVTGPETDDRVWNAIDAESDVDVTEATSDADADRDADTDLDAGTNLDADTGPEAGATDESAGEPTPGSGSAVEAEGSATSDRDGITIDPVDEDTSDRSATADPTTESGEHAQAHEHDRADEHDRVDERGHADEHDRFGEAPDADRDASDADRDAPDDRAEASGRKGRLWSDPAAATRRSTSDRRSPEEGSSEPEPEPEPAEATTAGSAPPSGSSSSDEAAGIEGLETSKESPPSTETESWGGADHDADVGATDREPDAEAVADLPAFDVLEPGSNALVLGSLSGPVSEAACGRLLDADGGAPADVSRDRNVLIVAIEEPAAERIDVCHRAGIDAGEIAAIEVGSHGGPRSVASETTGGGQSVSLTRVSKPSNLSKLGILITKQLSEWADDDRPVVFCLHSLTALQQYVSDEKLFRFLHVLTRRLSASGGRAHFHMDPDAHHEMIIGTLRPIFDVVVRIGPNGTVDVDRE